MRYVEVLAQQSRRVVSVDALRGFNFIWILGGDGAIWALADMLHDKGPVRGALGDFLEAQLHHAPWEGFTFYDFVFPLFIFITGVAIVLSLPRLVEREGRAKAHWRVLRRALLLYGLGLIYYGGMTHGWQDIRFLGVLQRIAICYMFAALLFLNFDLRGLAATCGALLVGYWALMTFVPVPGIGAGHFGPDQNLANWIDANYLPGRLWDKTRDPEGLLSTLPAIGTCLLGVFAGMLLRDIRVKPGQKSLCLIGAGIALVLAGHLWACNSPSSRRSGPRPSCWSPAAIARSCSGSRIRSSTCGASRNGRPSSCGSAPTRSCSTSSTASSVSSRLPRASSATMCKTFSMTW